jgi:hypothetical protein
MPLCALVFFIYFHVDKMLLLRHYHKPPKMGDAVMRVVLDFLPWAAIIRLAIACWMLSNYQLFPESKLLISESSSPLSLDLAQIRCQASPTSTPSTSLRSTILGSSTMQGRISMLSTLVIAS